MTTKNLEEKCTCLSRELQKFFFSYYDKKNNECFKSEL